MRQKRTPQKSLPIGIVLWERLVNSKSKRKLKVRDRVHPIDQDTNVSSGTLGPYMNYLLEQEFNDKKLTILQKHLIRILHVHGGSTSIDNILEEINKIWNISASTGSDEIQLISDPRKAVFAILANSSQSSDPIFVRDNLKGDGWWKLGPRTTKLDLDAIEEESKFVTNDSDIEDEAEGRSSKRQRLQEPPEFNELQTLIIDAINKNGGSATLDDVLELVPQLWEKKMDSDIPDNLDQKIVLELTDSSGLLFEDHQGSWRLTSKANAWIYTKPSKSQPRLTGMQDMLMRIVLSYGGTCTFDQIYKDVVQTDNQWGSDYKRITRAILASLSHNPPGNFKRTAEGLWTISPKAMAVARVMVAENPQYSLSKISN